MIGTEGLSWGNQVTPRGANDKVLSQEGRIITHPGVYTGVTYIQGKRGNIKTTDTKGSQKVLLETQTQAQSCWKGIYM